VYVLCIGLASTFNKTFVRYHKSGLRSSCKNEMALALELCFFITWLQLQSCVFL